MKTAPLTGRNFSATGDRYIPHTVRTSKNLSRPARKAPTPSPTRSAHHADSRPLVNKLPGILNQWSGPRQEELQKILEKVVTFSRGATLFFEKGCPRMKPVDPPVFPDEEVVSRVKAGETALFEVLMRRYNQRLFRVTRSILRNDA